MELKPTVYLETTIPSYYAAKPSRDILILSRQTITREWWEYRMNLYNTYISQAVIDEVSKGDPEAVKKRLECIKDISLISINPDIEDMATKFLQELRLPPKAGIDALHLAIAAYHHIDYLLTWNCDHLANGDVRRTMEKMSLVSGEIYPTICTPEELMESV